MGRRIPREIRRQVKYLWLDAKSRDEIAKITGISNGSVSAIIDDLRKDDPDFDLLRAIAVKLKNQDMDVKTFAPLLRLYEVLKEQGLLTGTTGSESLGLVQDRIESLVVGLEALCYKQGLSIEDFVGLVTNMYNTADSLGVSLGKFPAYIIELKNTIDALRKVIVLLEKKKQDALNENETTLELLREYVSNRPIFSQIQKLKDELENTEFWNKVEEQRMWGEAADEIERIHISMGYNRYFYDNKRPGDELKEMIMDVFDNPDAYMSMLRNLRDSYDKKNIKGNRNTGSCDIDYRDV